MVNISGSRKSNESKNVNSLCRRVQKNLQIITEDNLQNVLLNFQNHLKNESDSLNLQSMIISNQNLSKCIRQLLCSLKSILDKPNPQEFDKSIISVVVQSLNILQKVYSDDNSSFPETNTLAAICVPFLLINFLKYQLKNDRHALQVALIINFHLIFNPIELTEDDLMNEINNSKDTNLSLTLESMTSIQPTSTQLKFQHAALFYGLLNCNPILQILLNDSAKAFLRIFPYLTQFCTDRNKIHEFHLFRLLNQYLKITWEQRNLIEKKIGTISYCNHLLKMFEETIPIIDSNWESPINGVNALMKQNYQYLIDLIKSFEKFQPILIEQFKFCTNLPYTSKAKYKKLTVLNQSLGKENILTKLCQLPFEMDSSFSIQIMKHLSINSLSTAICEYYKSSMVFIKHSIDHDQIESISKLWSKLWLQSLVFLFKSNQIQVSVVQNCLAAHILPSTIKNIPESFNLFMQHLNDCLYGQACLVRIFLENSQQNQHKSSSILELPKPEWLLSLLCNSDDMTRAEGLALLVGEKFLLRNDRIQICSLVFKFLLNNLNVDNASFRQRINCLLEQFFAKLIISLSDRFDSETQLSLLTQEQCIYLEFLNKTMNLLLLSLCPGSSFQRKFTALNLIGSILELIQKHDKNLVFANFFRQLKQVPMETMLLYGLIDKDDKIRRLCLEVLIQYSQSSLSNCCQSFQNDCSLINNHNYLLAINYIQSFRHQECHIGGLMYKYLILTNDLQQRFFFIESLIKQASDLFYSEKFRQNLLQSSKIDPLHGWILALNHCCTFDVFYQLPIINNSVSTSFIDDETLREKIFQPTIQMCLDSLEYFLKLLTPQANTNYSDQINYEDDDDNEFKSPSFLEMCQSLKTIVESQKQEEEESSNEEDFSTSNKFQLLLSMCWLNLKESCFLLANLTRLYADLLCLYFTKFNEIKVEKRIVNSISGKFLLISPQELYLIGSKIAKLMQKCRHKGVIEACGVAMIKYTRASIRIQYYLNQLSIVTASISSEYSLAMKNFIEEILSVITNDDWQTSTSITRRSAGLALIIQSVLIGEAESIHLDGIKPIDYNVTLYEKFISLLIQVAESPVMINEQMSTGTSMVDLPQANALHVLRSIIGTSALSQLSFKTVVDLFPICLQGFQCFRHWQIRNASLQLFGACVQRMLGQKKRTKTAVTTVQNPDESDEVQLESTITIEEFHCRYPRLLSLICDEFESTKDFNAHRPELVPILALLASFSPSLINETSKSSSLKTEQTSRLEASLIKFLSNRCWKIRMLAAKSLSNLLSIQQLDLFIIEFISNPKKSISSNSMHGLICCTNHLFAKIKAQNPNSLFQNEKYQIYYEHFHQNLINDNNILKPLIEFTFLKHENLFNENYLDEDDEDEDTNETEEVIECKSSNLINELIKIKSKISFKQPDNVRLTAAQQIVSIIENEIKWNFDSLFEISSIVLTLFEDEDRQVRFEVQRLASTLFNKKEHQEYENHSTFSQTVSIDCFFHWLKSEINDWHQIIFQLFLQRLLKSKNYLEQENDEENVDVLFEKEEKNVFAEPYLMNIRLVTYLLDYSINQQHLDNLKKKYSTEFLKIIHFFQHKYEQLIVNKHHTNLMTKSIWKLPKYFCFIVNLYLSFKLVNFFQLQTESEFDSRTIEKQFLFLEELCSNIHSKQVNSLIYHKF